MAEPLYRIVDRYRRSSGNAPAASQLQRDPATGRLVEPNEMSEIGLDLLLNRSRDQQAIQANRGAFNVQDMLYALMTNGGSIPRQLPVAQDNYGTEGTPQTPIRRLLATLGIAR